MENTAPTQDQKKAYTRFEATMAAVAAPLFWGGQWIQDFQMDGAYVFPEFARYHLTNIVDPIACAPVILMAMDQTPMTQKNKALATAFIVAALGIGWETYQSQQPNRSFDYEDLGCYMVGTLAAYGLRRRTMSALQITNSKGELITFDIL